MEKNLIINWGRTFHALISFIFIYEIRKEKLFSSESKNTGCCFNNSENLKWKIKNNPVCRIFHVNRKVIETELFFLKTGLDNYFIELDNC